MLNIICMYIIHIVYTLYYVNLYDVIVVQSAIAFCNLKPYPSVKNVHVLHFKQWTVYHEVDFIIICIDIFMYLAL